MFSKRGLSLRALACPAEAHTITVVRLRWLTFQASFVGTAFAHIRAKAGAGNGIRTRDFDLGKVALYH